MRFRPKCLFFFFSFFTFFKGFNSCSALMMFTRERERNANGRGAVLNVMGVIEISIYISKINK